MCLYNKPCGEDNFDELYVMMLQVVGLINNLLFCVFNNYKRDSYNF